MQNSQGKSTRSPEEYRDTFQDISRWLNGGGNPGAEPVEDYWYPLFRPITYLTGLLGEYMLLKREVDPFVDDLKLFFSGIAKWIKTPFSKLATWFVTLESYIESLWNSISAAINWVATWIWERIEGAVNWIGNVASLMWWWIGDIWTYLTGYIVTPLVSAWHYLTDTVEKWLQWIWAVLNAFWDNPMQWVFDLASELWEQVKALGGWVWDSMTQAADLLGSWLAGAFNLIVPRLGGMLRDVAAWIWEYLKRAYYYIKDEIGPAVWGATTGALGWLTDQFTYLMGTAYDEMLRLARSFIPITPERAVALAPIMFGSAVGFGALAHGIALSVEAVPYFKYMGVHYLSGFAAHMGGFGAISGATMGVIAALALRTPFTYYINSLLRPIQPREMDLQIMAVKPDITIPTFRQGMKYLGYSDFWIDAIQRTMYREPRYFELSMMGEDEAATSEWLFLKARRAGYTETDSGIFVSSLLKKVTRTQRIDLYRQASYAFKEGYISVSRFTEYLDALEMRPEAREFSIMSANLAYQSDLFKELISTYQRAFRDDMITLEELEASLSILGLREERIDSLVDLEWTRKEPKILKAERKEIETQWRKAQAEYSRVYIESFRRGLIKEAQLESYLIAIGVDPRVAKATARYEAIKLVPKPKPPVIPIPVIPVPPEPPEYED